MNVQELYYVIKMFPEEASNEFWRSAENSPKIENYGAGIYF